MLNLPTRNENLESINLGDIANDHAATTRAITYLLKAQKVRAEKDLTKQKGPKDL